MYLQKNTLYLLISNPLKFIGSFVDNTTSFARCSQILKCRPKQHALITILYNDPFHIFYSCGDIWSGPPRSISNVGYCRNNLLIQHGNNIFHVLIVLVFLSLLQIGPICTSECICLRIMVPRCKLGKYKWRNYGLFSQAFAWDVSFLWLLIPRTSLVKCL